MEQAAAATTENARLDEDGCALPIIDTIMYNVTEITDDEEESHWENDVKLISEQEDKIVGVININERGNKPIQPFLPTGDDFNSISDGRSDKWDNDIGIRRKNAKLINHLVLRLHNKC